MTRETHTNPGIAGETIGESASPQAPPRVLGIFTSSAMAMSTICILSGGITSFHVGFCSVGGAAIGIGWILGMVFALCVALTMGQVASAFPRAGGPGEWASQLGGNHWGWFTGIFNLAGIVTGIAAINNGFCKFVAGALALPLQYDAAEISTLTISIAVILTTLLQAWINDGGMRLTARISGWNGYLIVAIATAMTIILLAATISSRQGIDLSRLFTFTNYSGTAGKEVWPESANLFWLFALGLLLPAYTMTGFDVSAQTTEETHDPEWTVPRAIWQAVVISGIAGWFMLSAIVLAAPDLEQAAASGDQVFFQILQSVAPAELLVFLFTGIAIANFICGLAFLTSGSRLTWALARDHGLPLPRTLRQISSTGNPSASIWAVGLTSAALPLVFSYETLAAVCAIFCYISYVIPTLCGLMTHGRWPRQGPWHLGAWYRPLALISVGGCLSLLFLGIQPPNHIAILPIATMSLVLMVLWKLYFSRYYRSISLSEQTRDESGIA